MPPSRRATLGLLGSATVALLAGCTAGSGGSDAGGTNESTAASAPETGESGGTDATVASESRAETDSEPSGTADASGTAGAPASVEMRLVGPETEQVLFTGEDVARVGEAQRYQTSYGLPITLDDDATERIGDTLNAAGVEENPEEFEFVLRRGGEEVSRFGIMQNLATDMAEGEWEGEFVLTTEDEAAAESLRETLRSE